MSGDAYGWAAVVRNGAFLFATLAFAAVSPWLAAPFIGLAMYRLTIVMHDCIHRTLLTDPALNVRVGRWLGALTGIKFERFRAQHLRHHRLYGRPGDPQGFHYLGVAHLRRPRFAWHVLRPLVGYNLRYAWSESFLNPRNLRLPQDLVRLLIMQALVAAIVTHGGAHPWLALLPPLSAATFGLFFSQLRGMAEHGAIGGRSTAGNVRSHAPHWFDRLFLYDLNFNYHAEHHLHPGVPSRQLATSAAARPIPRSMLCTVRRMYG